MNPQSAGNIGRGCVFRAEDSEAFCFVPEDCLVERSGRRAGIDWSRYISEGWSARNLHLADASVPGSHLFPDVARPVEDWADPEVEEFLSRAAAFGRRGTGPT